MGEGWNDDSLRPISSPGHSLPITGLAPLAVPQAAEPSR